MGIRASGHPDSQIAGGCPDFSTCESAGLQCFFTPVCTSIYGTDAHIFWQTTRFIDHMGIRWIANCHVFFLIVHTPYKENSEFTILILKSMIWICHMCLTVTYFLFIVPEAIKRLADQQANIIRSLLVRWVHSLSNCPMFEPASLKNPLTHYTEMENPEIHSQNCCQQITKNSSDSQKIRYETLLYWRTVNVLIFDRHPDFQKFLHYSSKH